MVILQIEDPSSQAQIRAAEKLTSQENSGRPKEPEQETTAQIDEEDEDEEVCEILKPQIDVSYRGNFGFCKLGRIHNKLRRD